MKKIKEIAIVTLDMGHGGAERVFSELVGAWVESGIKVSIIQTRPNTRGNNYELHKDVHMIDMEYPQGRFHRKKQADALVKLLRQMPDAVVISFMPQTKLLVGMASFFIKNKIVFTERNDPARSPATKTLRAGRNLVYRFADLIVFQTQQAKEYFAKSIQKKGHIIANPINPYLPEPYTGERKKVIIAAARLEEQKNLPMLIKAFAMFHKEFPDYTLEIYGKGPLEEDLNRLIREQGVADSAFLMGYSDNIYPHMLECAMYASSSDFEGISNSMLEAMGMGIPTICTDCPVGGARETIEDGVNGLLVPVGDTDALYRAMARVAGDPQLAQKMSENGVKLREDISVEKIASQWIDVMSAAL